MTMRTILSATVLAVAVTVAGSAVQAQQGPVASACSDEIKTYCAGKQHARREIRMCLEANKDKVSAACKTALETTGPGKGMRRMQQQ